MIENRTLMDVNHNIQIPLLEQSNINITNHRNQYKLKPQQLNDMDKEMLPQEEQADQDNTSISKRDWTAQEDELVYRLHNQYGNKWAIIADQLKGRSDNCVKNHFYSRLRKGLRKVNKNIEDYHKQEFKEFKIIDLYKVIEASDQKFKEVNSYPNQMTDFGHDLKNRIFIFAEEEPDGTQQFIIRANKLLNDLNDFTKKYKRKSKKSRRYSPMGVGSVYRNNSKKLSQTGGENDEQQIQKNQQQTQQKDKVKIQCDVKIEENLEPKQRKVRPKKQVQKNIQNISKQTACIPIKKEFPAQQHGSDEPVMIRGKNRNTYRKFSDDEGEQKDETQYQKQQRLNHFAQNILKTFKSYYSFKSFKSNSAMEQPFFE